MSNEIKSRFLENKCLIDSSHNIELQKLYYCDILDKFSILNDDVTFNIILKEFNEFNTNFLMSVPPDDVQKSGLWKFWPLTNRLNSFEIEGNKFKCIDFFKKTYNIVKKIDPENILSLGFSVLQPGCELNAHTGYHNNMPHNTVFRLHLPIIVPDHKQGDLGMHIYENIDEPGYGPAITKPTRTINWNKGELIVFDDSYKHVAWNNTKEPRVVLLIDYIHRTKINKYYTARSPLTGEIESIEKVARDFFNFLWDEINRLNYVQESIDET